jgi:DNA repair protein RadD
MAFELRPFQKAALDALDAYLAKAGHGNPVAALATATGKSLIIAWLIRETISRNPNARPLMLVHVQELIQQNVEHLLALWPDAPLGVNCAALGRRDWDQQIVFASIQSVFRSPEKLGHRDLVAIDECHLVPPSDTSMYRSTLGALRELCPAMLICGFSATPFRLDSGLICEGEDRIFDEVIFDYDIAQGIADGWLSPLSSKGTRTTIDVRGVGKRGGEFIADQLERAADVEEIVGKACDEMVHQGIGRNCWLVFCCGIGHALHVRDALRQRGVSYSARRRRKSASGSSPTSAPAGSSASSTSTCSRPASTSRKSIFWPCYGRRYRPVFSCRWSAVAHARRKARSIA